MFIIGFHYIFNISYIVVKGMQRNCGPIGNFTTCCMHVVKLPIENNVENKSVYNEYLKRNPHAAKKKFININ